MKLEWKFKQENRKEMKTIDQNGNLNNTEIMLNKRDNNRLNDIFQSMRYRNYVEQTTFEPRHKISNNVVCATSRASDQPVYTRSPMPWLVA